MNMVKAIVTEISNLCKLGVFSLEVMEDSSNPISTKFVLKVKRKADGSYDKHKARLVVRGFLAKMGVDFYATFSPMSSLITARTLMALAVHHNLPIAHADIPQAFVQSVLKRPLYCKFPQGVEICPKLLAPVDIKTLYKRQYRRYWYSCCLHVMSKLFSYDDKF